MSLERLLHVALSFLLLIGAGALFSTGDVGLEWILVFLLAWMTGFLRGIRGKAGWGLRGWVGGFLAISGVLCFFVMDLTVWARDLPLSVVHSAVLMSAFRYLTARNTREQFQVFLAGLGLLLLSTVYAFHLSFLGYASGFFILGTISLMIQEMQRSSRSVLSRQETSDAVNSKYEDREKGAYPIHVPALRIAGLSLLIFLMVVIGAGPVFVLLPRVSLGAFQLRQGRGQQIAGFSDSTHLGDLLDLQQGESVVMRVRARMEDRPIPSDIKWRGICLDKFDGRNWSVSNFIRSGLQFSPDMNGKDLQFRRFNRSILEQEFFLEPMNTRIIFLANRQLRVFLRHDTVKYSGFFIETRARHLDQIRYTGFSEIPDQVSEGVYGDEQLRDPGATPELAICLEIPKPTPRLKTLVAQLVGNVREPRRKAKILMDYVRSQCRYSLRVPPCPTDRDLAEFFLYDAKAGHCEYFASTYAILLRYADIPARVVNGFIRGDRNPITGTYVVRQRHAHAWVEAYFGKAGWTEIDPTPPGARDVDSSLGSYFENIMESIQFQWISSIVNFDRGDQYRLFFRIGEGSVDFKKWIQEKWLHIKSLLSRFMGESSGAGPFPFLAVSRLLILLLGLSIAGWIICRYFRFRSVSIPGKTVIPEYLVFLEKARRAGYARKSSETPAEHARRVAEAVSDPTLAEMATHYYQIRYGKGGEDSREKLRILISLAMERMKHNSKRKRRSMIPDSKSTGRGEE